VFHFHQQVGAKKPLQIFAGSSDFRRDFVFVEDAVALNLFLLDHPEVSGIFNCGTGRAESFRTLAEVTAKHYPGARIEEIPFPPELAGKYQDFTQADLAHLRRAGCAHEFTPLEAGVGQYVAVLRASGGFHRSPLPGKSS
jgi:ADP-L-glycero-D-manno-heptose 6-epimerase